MENENKKTDGEQYNFTNPPSGKGHVINVTGGTNTIGIIETQNNDSSAVKELERGARIQETQYKMIQSVIESIAQITKDFMAKKAAAKAPENNVVKPKRKSVKTKSKKRK